MKKLNKWLSFPVIFHYSLDREKMERSTQNLTPFANLENLIMKNNTVIQSEIPDMSRGQKYVSLITVLI